MGIPQVSHKELGMFFDLAVEIDEPILIVGKPGQGKSHASFNWTTVNNYKMIMSIPVNDDMSKYRGYPAKSNIKVDGKLQKYGKGKYAVKSDGELVDIDDIDLDDMMDDLMETVEEHGSQVEIEGAVHLPYDEVLQILTATEPTIWFIDDLGPTPPLLQAALMQALEARYIAGYKIPDCVRIFACTNGREHGSAVKGLLEAVKDRFFSIVELVTTVEDFMEYGIKNNLYQPLLDFIAATEEEGDTILNDFSLSRGMEPNTSPRRFEKFSKALLAGGKDWPDTLKQPMRQKLCMSCIGERWGRQFAAYLNYLPDMPRYVDIISDPENYPVNQKMDIRFAIIGMLAREARKEDADRIFVYIRKLKKPHQAVFMRQIYMRKSELRHTREAQLWDAENADLVV